MVKLSPCGADGSHEDALGTGSVFKDGNTYYAFYTGHNGDLDPKEIIYWATSTDLKTWTKDTQHSFELLMAMTAMSSAILLSSKKEMPTRCSLAPVPI